MTTRPKITIDTKWLTSVQALKKLQLFDDDRAEDPDYTPDTRPLKKLADEKKVMRVKFKGNKYKYLAEDIEAVFMSRFR